MVDYEKLWFKLKERLFVECENCDDNSWVGKFAILMMMSDMQNESVHESYRKELENQQ